MSHAPAFSQLALGGCGRTVASLALGPGRRSEFFDPKVRVTPRPIEVRRGKSGHRRARCRASFTASAGAARQGAVTDSVTENRQPASASQGADAGDGEKVG